MQITGTHRIEAARALVWKALNDPDVLRRCIPGCQSLEKESDERLRATVEIKIGPIGARFVGAVMLSELDPPNGYTLTGEGQAGTVGFAKGGAKVRLADDNGGTLLSYDVDTQVGGRLAQLGGAIIDATAKQLAGKFFRQFGDIVGATPDQPGIAATKAAPRGLPVAWMIALVAALLAGFLIGRGQGAAAGSDWVGVSFGLILVIVAAAGFECGRRAAAPVVVLDSALLARLAEAAKQ